MVTSLFILVAWLWWSRGNYKISGLWEGCFPQDVTKNLLLFVLEASFAVQCIQNTRSIGLFFPEGRSRG